MDLKKKKSSPPKGHCVQLEFCSECLRAWSPTQNNEILLFIGKDDCLMFSNQVLVYKVHNYNTMSIMELVETMEHSIQWLCEVNKKR